MTKIFKPGFRFSGMDAVILLVGIAGIVFASRTTPMYGLIIGFVLFHFFLFCNVFRISRKAELIWAGVFLGLTAAQLILGVPSWAVVFLVSIVLSQTLIALEFRRPSYHGVLWKQLNPKLEAWWQAQNESRS